MLQIDIGRKVRLLRRACGLTQEKLAVYSGLSVYTIRRIESGRSNPTTETLQAIAAVLDTTVVQLLSD